MPLKKLRSNDEKIRVLSEIYADSIAGAASGSKTDELKAAIAKEELIELCIENNIMIRNLEEKIKKRLNG